MFSKTRTTKAIDSCSAQIEQLNDAITQADSIVIGGGSGLSAAAGFTYSGPRFESYFGDFIEKYHYSDMYSAGFYPYSTPAEYWAYWSRHIYYNRFVPAPKPVYDDLLKLVGRKDYFVITINVDHCFQKSGFDKRRLFYTQGDYGLWQCSVPCHKKTYDNEKAVERMIAKQQDMRVPEELIPYCPVCGKPMTMNLRCDNRFVEDEGWHAAAGRWERFLHDHRASRILYLELGVGYNTPGIIKYPFWKLTALNNKAAYACINTEDTRVPSEIARQAICISRNIEAVLKEMSCTSVSKV